MPVVVPEDANRAVHVHVVVRSDDERFVADRLPLDAVGGGVSPQLRRLVRVPLAPEGLVPFLRGSLGIAVDEDPRVGAGFPSGRMLLSVDPSNSTNPSDGRSHSTPSERSA